MAKDIVLFDPESDPFRTMASYPTPSALQVGEFPLIENFRADDRSLRVRNGYGTAINANAVIDASGTTFKGLASKQVLTPTAQANNPVLLAAMKVGTKTQLYATNTGTFAKETAAAGQWGATEWTYSGTDNSLFYFGQVFSGDQTDSAGQIVIQSGTDSPRVYGAIDGTFAVCSTITAPSPDSGLMTIPTWPKNFEVSGASMPTYTNSTAAQFAGSSNGTTPNNNVRLVTGTGANAVQNGDNVIVDAFATATRDLSACRQLIIVCETTDIVFWQNVKIEIYDNGLAGYTTVYDGSVYTGVPPVYAQLDGVSNRYAIGFSLDHIVSTSRDAVSKIKFTWSGTTRAAAVAASTVDIYAICGSGKIPGGRLHGISYWDSASRAESPGMIIGTVLPKKLKDVGGTTISTAQDTRIPMSTVLYYDYGVQYQNTSAATQVNYVRIYAKDHKEVKYTYVGKTALTAYAAGWTFSSGAALGILTYTDTTAPYLKDTSLEFPDAFSLPLPTGGPTIYANSRCFVGGYRASSTDIRDTLWISDERQGFRFRSAVRFRGGQPDPSSGTTITFPGEHIQQLVAASTGIFGVDRIHVFTDKSIYVVEGRTSMNLSRASKVANIGTVAPHSVAEYKGSIYFLDSELRVRRISQGRFDDLSRFLVDDQLQGIPAAQRHLATGIYWKDRYYLSFTPSGATTNTKILIWDETLNQGGGGWMRDGVSVGCQQMCIWVESGTRKPMFADATAGTKVYEYEKASQTTDAGSAIPIAITFPRFAAPVWGKHMVRKIRIVADDQANTLTWVRTYMPTGDTGTSQTNLNVAESQSYLYDSEPTASGTPLGIASQIAVTGNMTGITRIYNITAEVEELSSGAGRSA